MVVSETQLAHSDRVSSVVVLDLRQGTGEQGLGARDRGAETGGQRQGSRDRGAGTGGQGHGSRDRGPGTWEQRQGGGAGTGEQRQERRRWARDRVPGE